MMNIFIDGDIKPQIRVLQYTDTSVCTIQKYICIQQYTDASCTHYISNTSVLTIRLVMNRPVVILHSISILLNIRIERSAVKL